MGAAVAGTTSFRPAPSYTTYRDLARLLPADARVVAGELRRVSGEHEVV